MASTFDEIDDTLTAVARAVRRASAEQLGPHGIAMHQVRALRTIERLGGRPRIADLAERMRIAPRSATEVVDHLVEKGLATRSPNPDDRRSVVIEMTDAGHALLAEVGAVRREVAREFYGVLDADERAELLRLLRKVAP
ncbi:MarR family transcriptional regulator [Epidermidibacterium keratini]|uniref:MarR family transcriptional regulator n=1 Tax=Epidermidibacterium keratini TaxID=1891644 RepID=A0A7L4YLN2_9ACTN|nr:MarR family transcriptional regulator [Epidermidibacterium keratini]QHB99951.1 MarR family transcriptional regulator [Epidermidibacterium keratini]